MPLGSDSKPLAINSSSIISLSLSQSLFSLSLSRSHLSGKVHEAQSRFSDVSMQFTEHVHSLSRMGPIGTHWDPLPARSQNQSSHQQHQSPYRPTSWSSSPPRARTHEDWQTATVRLTSKEVFHQRTSDSKQGKRGF